LRVESSLLKNKVVRTSERNSHATDAQSLARAQLEVVTPVPLSATMVVAGNAAKFTTQGRTLPSEQINSARNVEREELKEENRRRRHCA
jgi:hypothetical protein